MENGRRNKSVGHHVESPTKTIEFLHGEIKEMEFEAMELAHENATLKLMMSTREAAWKRDKQAMQDQIDSAKQGPAYDSGRAMQTELEDELKELKLVLRDKEKYINKLSSRPRNDQFEIERVKRELNDKCNQVKDMEISFDKKMKHIISEKDAVIANVTNVKVALGHQNLELMAKLRGIQREVHPIETEWKTKANALEDSLKAEQAERKACYEKIKKMENLLKDSVESFKIMRKMEGVFLQMDDVIENVVLEQNDLLRSVQTEILQGEEEWKTKVNSLGEIVNFEQGEKIKDTEEKCAAKQEDSLNQDSNMEENMAVLMIQTTELQEPALTTANAEAGSQRRMNRWRN